ncbi:MAG: cellulase family glycosylhydrolase [Bacteroidia bacterium]|nr:cellulase family glycosylhydrolase [Bacteroidia bacterium]
MKTAMIFILLTASLLVGCSPRNSNREKQITGLKGIRTEGTRFVNSKGHTVILCGINLVEKNPAVNYIRQDTIGLFDRFVRWGFNCIRLGVIWDGAEPEPGKYDEAYLNKIETMVNRAAARGIYVLLDMHQDLYGRQFSDGAPAWATLTDSLPHATGVIWSDSYLMSPAVQRAFDNFWANKPAIDGIGVQDHYARLWKHIARRFAGNPAIVGYDIMNEPFNGSAGAAILPAILKEYATVLAETTGKVLSEDEIMETWADEARRIDALKFLEDPARYQRVVDAATGLNAEFERSALQAMYQRVADAIRLVDTAHILFLEHAYFANTGLATAIEPVRLTSGARDPLVAYAAHGYDLLTDTKQVDSQSPGRVDLIFKRIHEASKRMNIPVLVGEWGAFNGNSDGLVSATAYLKGLFNKYGFSDTYWAWYPGIEEHPYFYELRK